jgi:hypothetical protein
MPFGRAVEAGEADVRARRSVRAIGAFEQGSAATIGRGRTHETRDATPLRDDAGSALRTRLSAGCRAPITAKLWPMARWQVSGGGDEVIECG